jgi:hypothetical protein
MKYFSPEVTEFLFGYVLYFINKCRLLMTCPACYTCISYQYLPHPHPSNKLGTN